MKPHPRIRKTIKWGGAAVTALLVVAWIGSGWFFASMFLATWGIGITSGGMMACAKGGDNSTLPAPGVYGGLNTRRFSVGWRPIWSVGPGGGWNGFLPLVYPAALGAIVTVASWCLDARARRRAGLNLCPKCDYDRAGIAAGARCPECGAAGVGGARGSGR